MKRKNYKILFFVYNANYKKRTVLLDTDQKIINPSTYFCDLCNLTFGKSKEKKIWKNYKQNTLYTFLFFHKNEFQYKYKKKFNWPVVLEQQKKGFKEVFTAKQISEMKNIRKLITSLQTFQHKSTGK